jgi:hypothetical protein
MKIFHAFCLRNHRSFLWRIVIPILIIVITRLLSMTLDRLIVAMIACTASEVYEVGVEREGCDTDQCEGCTVCHGDVGDDSVICVIWEAYLGHLAIYRSSENGI